MKKPCSNLLGLLAALSVVPWVSAAWAADSGGSAEEFPYAVAFELGQAEFAPGDNITIQAVHGTSSTITTGETYCVEGTYTLSSKPEANLSLFATIPNSGPTPVDPKQTVHILQGSGSFRLIKTVAGEGYLHVSFYSGSAFGGVYFGQGQWVLSDKGFSNLGGATPARDSVEGKESSPKPVSVSGANRVLFEYLGDPVEPPADLDPAYSREGLLEAVRVAAGNAGISLKRVEIDDSEFPFLVAVVSGNDDFAKLTDQLKKLENYHYSGSVGNSTCNAINIVPYRAFPPAASQRISRRLTVRQQILYDRTSAQQ
jgi:hypothetical protein